MVVIASHMIAARELPAIFTVLIVMLRSILAASRCKIASRRFYSTEPPKTPRKQNEIQVVPLVVIFLAGTGAYVYMVKQRAANTQQVTRETENTTSRYRRNA